MKLVILVVHVLVAFAVASTWENLLREQKRELECTGCERRLEFCNNHGHTPGQTGCLQSCREHVCHRHPECKKCPGEFDQCPEKSRYLN